MTFAFSAITAREILDSRGRPTLAVQIHIGGRPAGAASVPSGASTGRREAVERRDGDRSRFGGAGVLGAVSAVDTELAGHLCGQRWNSLAELDAALIALDGTATKSRLGANAIVGVSMAAARAVAHVQDAELWTWLCSPGVAPRLPVPHFNVLNGGVHAPNALEFQEFMIAPIGAPSMAEAVRAGAEVYAALRGRLRTAGLSTGLGDEGGFAPELDTPEQACELLVAAIGDAGYEATRDGVALALDPAASEFYTDGAYRVGEAVLSATEMIERYAEMVERFPIWSLEDGLSEDDPDGWRALTDRLGDRVQIVGDDLFVTNPAAITDGVAGHLANAALIKLNQVGTVTETLDALRVCRDAGWGAMVSHRSGETTDDFIADLTVAAGCGQLKSGAPARGERVAKYNRLLEIAGTARGLPYGLAAR